MQTGPLYPPETFRTLFLPRFRRRWQAARAYLDQVNPSVKLMFHTDGGIRPFIPDLIEIGMQVLDPVQPLATGMESAELKRDFGDALIFHGGVDNQQTLAFGTAEDVREEVGYNIDVLGKEGGYILAPCHNIQAVSPAENIVAMYEAGKEFG